MPGIDSTLHLMQDPYRFISREAKRLKRDVFETRLLLEKTICMTGKDAAKIFADEELFVRKGAAPRALKATLFGSGGVQMLDGEAHVHRKQFLMSFMTPDNALLIQNELREWLQIYSFEWEKQEVVSLYEQFQEILTRTISKWVGIEIPENELKQRTKELSSLYDSAGSIKKHFSARVDRKRTEKWISELIQEIRDGKRADLTGTPVYSIAKFVDIKGKLLIPHVAAVEVLNLLRPTIAVSVFFVFAVHALHLHPESRQRLKAQEPGFLDNFINEVRRFYPFFPFIVAKVRQDFKWGRFHFKKGKRALLDIYGINHDPSIWERPQEFRPDRFKELAVTPFNFVPQGLGDHTMDHRCPGEFFTIELMRSLVSYFVNELSYDVPKQKLEINFKRLPALPVNHMLIGSVRRQHPFLYVTPMTAYTHLS